LRLDYNFPFPFFGEHLHHRNIKAAVAHGGYWSAVQALKTLGLEQVSADRSHRMDQISKNTLSKLIIGEIRLNNMLYSYHSMRRAVADTQPSGIFKEAKSSCAITNR
jgi:hypothetical protein